MNNRIGPIVKHAWNVDMLVLNKFPWHVINATAYYLGLYMPPWSLRYKYTVSQLNVKRASLPEADETNVLVNKKKEIRFRIAFSCTNYPKMSFKPKWKIVNVVAVASVVVAVATCILFTWGCNERSIPCFNIPHQMSLGFVPSPALTTN